MYYRVLLMIYIRELYCGKGRVFPLFFIFSMIFIGPLWASAQLPAGWSDADIGNPSLAGSADFTNGIWTVTGGGVEIGDTNDAFNFVSQPYGSDGAITAQVTSLQNTDTNSGLSSAGVMFRNDTTGGAANLAVLVTATQG